MKKYLFLFFFIFLHFLKCFSQIDSSIFLTNEVYTDVDKRAFLPGGENEFTKYCAENFHYPPIASKYKVTGTVKMVFFIDTTGSILYPLVMKGVSFDLNDEASKLIRNMPKWIPAEKNGKKVTSVQWKDILFYAEAADTADNKFNKNYLIELADYYKANEDYYKAIQLYVTLYHLTYSTNIEKKLKAISYLNAADSIAIANNSKNLHCKLAGMINKVSPGDDPKKNIESSCKDELPENSNMSIFDSYVVDKSGINLAHPENVGWEYFKNLNLDQPCSGNCQLSMTFLLDTNGLIRNFQYINIPLGANRDSIYNRISKLHWNNVTALNGTKILSRQLLSINLNDSKAKANIENSGCKFYQDGIDCFKEELYEKAIKKFNNSFITCGKRGITYTMLGQCYLKLNKTKEACDSFNEALKLKDQRAEFYIQKYCGDNSGN